MLSRFRVLGKVQTQLRYLSHLPVTPERERFSLNPDFVRQYEDRKPPFGFGDLSEIVYLRTYSRPKADGKNELWRWIQGHHLGWDPGHAQASAQGRGLWAMGSPMTEERNLYAALNNCAFVSTDDMSDPSRPFVFLFEAALLGVGVGFDTHGAGKTVVRRPLPPEPSDPVWAVPDTREGWVESVRLLLDSYFYGRPRMEYRYDLIRPPGSLIAGLGGVSAGSGPLRSLHESLRQVLDHYADKPVTSTLIVDLMNIIGRCVADGQTRQTAEIAFGDPTDQEYVNLKNYQLNPQRAAWGWCSNNSVFAQLGMDYRGLASRIRDNGEPGIAWLQNMRNYSRMVDPPDYKDIRAAGGNPCLEQTLESYELCCLVETFPFRHDSLEDFHRTLKFAYLYAKTVTLGGTTWPATNRVMLRNRRIGCSLSGLAQFREARGLGALKDWMTTGYDKIQDYDRQYSEWMAIPRSIKTTSIKPSGTVSLLAGATPGLHYPIASTYIRRVRLPNQSPLLPQLKAAGYVVEPTVTNPETTSVVEIPIKHPVMRSVSEVSMWEQLSLAAFAQRYWADNQVSATVTFKPEEAESIPDALDYFQYQLKGVSFLPLDTNSYAQMPYEGISEEMYQERIQRQEKAKFDDVVMNAKNQKRDQFCDSDACQV